MDISTRIFAHGFLFCLGLILIVAGIATHNPGAPIIGLIVAAVNFRHWQTIHSEQTATGTAQQNR